MQKRARLQGRRPGPGPAKAIKGAGARQQTRAAPKETRGEGAAHRRRCGARRPSLDGASEHKAFFSSGHRSVGCVDLASASRDVGAQSNGGRGGARRPPGAPALAGASNKKVWLCSLRPRRCTAAAGSGTGRTGCAARPV